MLSVCLFSTGLFSANAQLDVSGTLTPQQLVEQVLLGNGITVSNVTFNGVAGTTPDVQAGAFTGGGGLGIGQGLLLTTGFLDLVVGPNDTDELTLPDFGIGTFGEPDLEVFANDFGIYDAAVLEFDLVPSGDSLEFRFVFGSEEYNEYVCTEYNDVFGFFLSGPGINGTFSNNAINLALIPGTTTPVAINTVNNGSPGAESTTGDEFCVFADPDWDQHTALYVDNANSTAIQLDGMTVPLVARARVQCGQTYHIKIAVGDAGDWQLDSGVFIEQGSFQSPGAIDATLVLDTPDGTLTEGCDTARVVLMRDTDTDTLHVTLASTGTATNGVDHSAIPGVVSLLPGQDSLVILFTAFEDALDENDEVATLTVRVAGSCGDSTELVLFVTIVDHVPIVLTAGDLVSDCTVDSLLALADASGGYGDLTLTWSTGTLGPEAWLPGRHDGTYTIRAVDGCERAVVAQVFVDSGCSIDIPNVFTPNGDGQNDRFVIEGIEFTSNVLRIYNRWGQVVYEATNYQNQWGGGDVTDGTYYYEVLVSGEEKPRTGHLTILDRSH